MALEHQIYTLAIVLIGEFNPVIISPFWLSSKKLIREQEAQSAKVEIIHNEITKFELEWAKIEVTKERFEIRTSQEPFFDPIRDLAISIFEILKETPITALGINHLKYYAVESEDTYYNFGNNLAPLSVWTEVLNDPRLFFLEIVETKRKDGLHGTFRARVKPSDIVLRGCLN
jgi:hypothetical protein